jgi:pimeloyl-ACP methyl ester carboxylesterase
MKPSIVEPITGHEPESGVAPISERERREIGADNASGNTPVVFIHGLWLLPSSWANWADFFKQAGCCRRTRRPRWTESLLCRTQLESTR